MKEHSLIPRVYRAYESETHITHISYLVSGRERERELCEYYNRQLIVYRSAHSYVHCAAEREKDLLERERGDRKERLRDIM